MASTSVEDDPLSGSHSDRILEFRTGTGSDWILKKLNRIRYGYSNCIAEVVPQPESTPARFCIFLKVYLMSSEISDLRKISDLLLFFCYFVSQNKEIQSGNCFFDVCCVNKNILVRYQVPTTSYSTGRTSTIENFRTLWLTSIIFFSHPNPNPNLTLLLKHEFLSPQNQFFQRIWSAEYYPVHACMV